MLTWIYIITAIVLIVSYFSSDNHENKELDDEIKKLMYEIKLNLQDANIICGIDYSIKYKRLKKKPFDYISLSFYNMDSKPTQWATPVARAKSNIFKVNPVLTCDNSAFYSKPYLRFNCIKEGFENYYIKVYFVHSAMGLFKTISESLDSGREKGRNVKGMFGDKR